MVDIERRVPTPTITKPEEEALFEVDTEPLLSQNEEVNIVPDTQGGVEVDFAPGGGPQAEGSAEDFDANLAEHIPDEELDEVGQDLLALVEGDLESRTDWDEIIADGVRLLGLKLEELSDPFPGACAATHPLLAENVIKYQAKASTQLLPPQGPVRTQILGVKDEEKEQQAKRVREFLNYQVMHQMPEYEPEHDRMLFHQAYMGSAFTKLYYDSTLGRPVSRFVKATDFVINYEATNLESAERYAETLDLSANDLKRHQLAGFYREVEVDTHPLGEENVVEEKAREIEGRTKTYLASPDDERYKFYEVHTYLDLPGFEHTDEEGGAPTGLQLPYIITIDSGSGKVLSIYRNWKEGDPLFVKRVWYVHWPFIPGLGFYGYGYIHLIGGLSRTATSTLRQLVDAGSFANLPAGFKAHGLRVVGENEPIQPGEWRDVNAPGQDIAKSLLPLPYKEPSATLFALLQFVVETAQRFADSTEQVVADSTNYGPVGTTMALLEAGDRLFNAIHKRLFKAQRLELRMLSEINSEYLSDEGYPFSVAGGNQKVFAKDFDMETVDVLPVSDPRTPSEAHRISRAQARLHIAGQFPQEHNMRELLKEMHSELGADEPERYLKPLPPQVQPTDPVSENFNMLQGKPVKAALPQNHMAHAQVHASILSSPVHGSNPQVKMAVAAHLQEHIAMDFLVRAQKAMGAQVDPSKPAPPEQDNQIAVAAARVTEQIVQEAQELVDGGQIDPMIEIQKEQVAIDRDRLSLDAIEVKLDDEFKRIKLMLDTKVDREEIDSREKIARLKGGSNA